MKDVFVVGWDRLQRSSLFATHEQLWDTEGQLDQLGPPPRV